MISIFFWSADRGGCAWYRCSLPAAALADRGHHTLVSMVLPDEWRDGADVIVGQRVCQPGATRTWQQLAQQGRAKLVFDIDDDLFDIDPSNGPAWGFFTPDMVERLRRNIEVADVVTVSTESLAEVIRPINPNVVVLSNCVPSWLLDLPAPESGERVSVGWGGGASHAADWAQATSEITRFVVRNPKVELHLMGWQPDGIARRLPADRYRATPWIGSVPDYYRAVDFHVGLAPLRPSVFNRSKSHIKTLELAALGVPVVASDAGPYPEFVRHGETGFLVRRPHEWARYLRELLDPTVAREMGNKARTLAAQHTIEGNVALWEKALLNQYRKKATLCAG